VLKESLAFRGGTALYKLFLTPPARYSEDIDLVQVSAEPAGDVMDALHDVLDPWLGEPRYRQSEGRVTFNYRFNSEDTPPVPLRLKVEINTREHFSVHGVKEIAFSVKSRWHTGACAIPSYGLNELLGTKVRALYQRKKGRDLFDLATALEHPEADATKIIEAFQAYMKHGGHRVTRPQFEENLQAKLGSESFAADIRPLLVEGYEWDLTQMAKTVTDELIAKLPGQL
jgi:predicted nucleotidyltransferase component of viral defense system